MEIMPNKEIKILLVEDEPVALTIHKKMIESLGYFPDIAENGKVAIKLSNQKYNLIFMDIGLPDIDGLEVTRYIRKCEEKNGDFKSAAYIVALTGYLKEEINEKCTAVKINEIMTKPIKIIQLESVLKRIINKS